MSSVKLIQNQMSENIEIIESHSGLQDKATVKSYFKFFDTRNANNSLC